MRIVFKPFIFSDCWYLYALNPLDRFISGRVNLEPDQTIEILMTELDPQVMEIFNKANSTSGRDATKVYLKIHQKLQIIILHFLPKLDLLE